MIDKNKLVHLLVCNKVITNSRESLARTEKNKTEERNAECW